MYSAIEMLINRNIRVGDHRTSIRLEPEFWAALADIARREDVTINDLCTEIDRGAGKLKRTAAVRLFVMSYMVRLSPLAAEQQQLPFAAVVSGHAEPQQIDAYPICGLCHQTIRRVAGHP